MHVCISVECQGSKVERKNKENQAIAALMLSLALYRSASTKKLTTIASTLNFRYGRSMPHQKI